MSAEAEKQDLRIKRTRKALKDALRSLLSRRSFDKITVNDLCEEALVSRTGFYAHFRDKYVLLKYFLEEIKNDIEDYEHLHSARENIIYMNEYISQNSMLMKNMVDQGNAELMDLLISMIGLDVRQRIYEDEEVSAYGQALVDFCAGGFANLLLRQIKNDFPMERGNFGEYVDRILQTLKSIKD